MFRRPNLKKAAATAAIAVPAAMGALALSAGAAGASPASYVVQPGDTLSSIAAAHGTSWSALAAENHLANPNLIFAGQVIELGGSSTSTYSAPAHTYSYSAPVHTYSAHTYSAPVRTYSAPVRTYSAPVTHTTSSASASPNSSFQSCVIQKESSGNAQAMNGSGHYGLYQFDLSTWVSGGGSASTFGHASAAQQNAVFNSVYAARGSSPWGPYDGC